MNEPVYELRNTAVGYRGQVLIHDIGFELHAGEIVTLIGPNGAGKSTILKTMAKQLDALGGSILLNGRELSGVGYAELAKEVSILLTGRIRPEMMTNRDVVESGRYPYTGRMGLLTSRDREIAVSCMKKAGVLAIADRPFAEISDGQKQRVLFARALCQKPKVLILDEPTSYLDIRHKLSLLSTLRNLAQEEHLAVILSLHEIDLAQKISDRIIFVKGTTISKIGTPEELFCGGMINELYGIEEGSYSALTGGVELHARAGKPEAFVMSAGGSGIPIYRRLLRSGVPFAAGILYENDIDFHVAREMAVPVVSEAPFAKIGDKAFEAAAEIVRSVNEVLLVELPIGESNRRMLDLIALADELKKLTRVR